MFGSVPWQNVEYTQDSNRDVIGRTPLRIPTRFGSLWVNCEAPESSFASKFGAGVGGCFSNGTKGGTIENQFSNAGYGEMDAEVHYYLGHLTPNLKDGKFQVTAQNPTDHQYITSSFAESQGCFYGAERAVIAKLSWDF